MLQPCAGGKAGRARCGLRPGSPWLQACMDRKAQMDMGSHMTDTTVEDL